MTCARARARETLTLHVEPGLVPVLPFGVDGLALVRAHVFVLHVVEVQRRARFADLVVGRQVCGVHFPPYDVRDGTDNKRVFLFYNMSANRIGCFEAVPLMIVNRTYFPRAKHSSVMLEASRAVVSGNFTLMSAGYFLSSPEAIKKKKEKKVIFEMRQQNESAALFAKKELGWVRIQSHFRATVEPQISTSVKTTAKHSIRSTRER